MGTFARVVLTILFLLAGLTLGAAGGCAAVCALPRPNGTAFLGGALAGAVLGAVGGVLIALQWFSKRDG